MISIRGHNYGIEFQYPNTTASTVYYFTEHERNAAAISFLATGATVTFVNNLYTLPTIIEPEGKTE